MRKGGGGQEGDNLPKRKMRALQPALRAAAQCLCNRACACLDDRCSVTRHRKTVKFTHETRALAAGGRGGHLQLESAAAERARPVAPGPEQAAQLWRHSFAASIAGIAPLYGDECVHEIKAADPGVGVADAVDDAAVGRCLPAGCCRELNFAIHVAGEAHESL